MEHIKEELTAQLQNPTAFTIPVLGGIPVSQSVVVSWILMAVLTAAVILMTRHLKKEHPRRVQLVLEYFVDFMNNFCLNNIGRHGRAFAPWNRASKSAASYRPTTSSTRSPVRRFRLTRGISAGPA